MKQWIKLETDIMYNHGVRRLYAEHRQYGLATYILLRLHIESLSDNGIPYEEAVNFGKSYARKVTIESILNDYGLFAVNDDDFVMPLELNEEWLLTHADGQTCGQADEQTCGQTCEQTDAPEPIQDENRKEKSGEKAPPTEEEVWKKEFRKHYPTLARMSEPLTLAQYKKLLDRYPNEMIINKLERMDNMTGFSRKYKSTYRVLINWLKD